MPSPNGHAEGCSCSLCWPDEPELAPIAIESSMRDAWRAVRQRINQLSNELSDAENKIAELEAELAAERERRRAADAELARLRALDDDIPHPRQTRRIEERHHGHTHP